MARTKKKRVAFSQEEEHIDPDGASRKLNGSAHTPGLGDLHDPAKLTKPINTVQVGSGTIKGVQIFISCNQTIGTCCH